MLFLFTGWANARGFNKIRIEIIHYCEVILKQQMQGRSWNVFCDYWARKWNQIL